MNYDEKAVVIIDRMLNAPAKPLADDALVADVVAILDRFGMSVMTLVHTGGGDYFVPDATRDIISAVRAYDAGLPCGHCDPPGLDSIRCGCVIGDDDDYVPCPDCGGSGIASGPDPACSLCGTHGTIPAFVVNRAEP